MLSLRRTHGLPGFVLPCLCAGMLASAPDAHDAAHGCCAPPEGLRAAVASCCADGHGDGITPAWTSVDALTLSVPTAPFTLRAAPVAAAPASAPPQRPVAASPPLRI